jgi:hypothetical protein
MKDLEKENQRLRRAISDLTLDKLILQEAAKGNFRAPRVGGAALIEYDGICQSGYPSDGYVGCWGSIDRHSAR